MSIDQWKSGWGWLGMVAAILIFSPLAQAQQEEVEVEKDVLLIVDDEDAPKPRPWLGLHCVPVDAALRAHVKLPEGQGLVVGSLAPDGPAMKAGIQASDILLKAGDQALKEVADLVKALEKSDGKPLAIELVRSGETKTIEVTPGERRASASVVEPLESPDRDIVRRWVERVREVPQIVEGLPERIRIFRAGIPVAAPFPKDLSLSITKEGDAPAKVIVKKGEEQWETTEDKLSELPESVRGPVETFLGKLPTAPFNISLPPPDAAAPARPQHPEAARAPRARGGSLAERGRDVESRARRAAEEAARRVEEAERRIRDQAEPQVERFGRRIEQLERQLQERLEKLDRLIEERTGAIDAAPAKPATPATPAQPAKPAPESGPSLPVPEET